jgi:putative membrane protein
MLKLALRLIINAIALWLAITFVPGIRAEPSWIGILGLALVFGLVNALLRPLLTLLTCPFLILTLGLGTLLINTLLFWLSGWIGTLFGFGFTVDGFWAAFFGALIVSLVSVVLTLLLKDEIKGRRPEKKR